MNIEKELLLLYWYVSCLYEVLTCVKVDADDASDAAESLLFNAMRLGSRLQSMGGASLDEMLAKARSRLDAVSENP